MLDHTLINEYIMPSVFAAYLMYRVYPRAAPLFRAVHALFYVAPAIYLSLVAAGFNVFEGIEYSWTTVTTPVQYMVFILVLYWLIYAKTDDQPYAVTLSLHMALVSGYLYEVPRWIYLQGLPRIIRFNRYGLFWVHYSIISVFLVAWLLCSKRWRINWLAALGVANYVFYCAVFYFGYEWLWSFRFTVYFDSFMIPWINLYRVPAMLMFLCLVSGISLYEEDWFVE